MLRVKLPRLESYTAGRRKNASLYRKALLERGLADEVVSCGKVEGRKPLVLPSTCSPGSIWNQFVLRVRSGKRDALQAHLKERRVGTEVYYPLPLHQQEAYRGLRLTNGTLPVTERAAGRLLSLPMFPDLTESEIDRVCAAIREFYGA